MRSLFVFGLMVATFLSSGLLTAQIGDALELGSKLLGGGKKEEAAPTTVVVQSPAVPPVSALPTPTADYKDDAIQRLTAENQRLTAANTALQQQVLAERAEKGDLKTELSSALENAGVPHSALISAIVVLLLAVAGNVLQAKTGKQAKSKLLDLFEDVSDALIESMTSKNETDQNAESVKTRNELKGVVVQQISKARKNVNKI